MYTPSLGPPFPVVVRLLERVHSYSATRKYPSGAPQGTLLVVVLSKSTSQSVEVDSPLAENRAQSRLGEAGFDAPLIPISTPVIHFGHALTVGPPEARSELSGLNKRTA